MAVKVVEEKPVPIYMVECEECHSKIEYTAADVAWLHITCPVCKTLLWAHTICPVRMDKAKSKEGGEAE